MANVDIKFYQRLAASKKRNIGRMEQTKVRQAVEWVESCKRGVEYRQGMVTEIQEQLKEAKENGWSEWVAGYKADIKREKGFVKEAKQRLTEAKAKLKELKS